MIVSWNWLNDYVKLGMAPADELAERLMMAGLNHEDTKPSATTWRSISKSPAIGPIAWGTSASLARSPCCGNGRCTLPIRSPAEVAARAVSTLAQVRDRNARNFARVTRPG